MMREQEGKLIAAAEGRVDGDRGRGRTQRCHMKGKDGENVKYRVVYDWFAEETGVDSTIRHFLP
jgi:hypothetical protein